MSVWKLRLVLEVMYLSGKGGLLKESRLVFVLHMGPELDLSLDPGELAGFIKRHRVGTVEYIIPCLEGRQAEERQ